MQFVEGDEELLVSQNSEGNTVDSFWDRCVYPAQ